MSNKIPSSISVNCEKVNREWVVELYFPGYIGDPVWIAKDKNKAKAIAKANSKLIRVSENLFEMEYPDIKADNFYRWSKKTKKGGRGDEQHNKSCRKYSIEKNW